MMNKYLMVAMCVGVAATVSAQTFIVRNPKSISFVCPDHDYDDNHEVDIISEATGQSLVTVLIGDPPLIGSLVMADIDIMPLAFGSYRFVVRPVSGENKAESSEPSAAWQRSLSKAMHVEAR